MKYFVSQSITQMRGGGYFFYRYENKHPYFISFCCMERNALPKMTVQKFLLLSKADIAFWD